MDEPNPNTTPATQPAFRTYASDLAKLGKGDATPVPAPVAARPAAPAPKPAAAHPAAAPAAPIAPPAMTPIPPPTHPYEPPPATIIPKAPSTDESREEILARLRARVAPETSAPAAAQPVAAPVTPKAPTTDERREEVLARLRGKGLQPSSVPPPLPAQSQGLSPIHTYKTDFSDKTKREGASPITVLAAEQNFGSAPAAPARFKESPKNRLLVIGSVILILAGGASVFFAYSFVTGRPIAPIAPLVPSLIFADRYEELRGSGGELRSALAEYGSKLKSGDVGIAYLTVASTTPKGATVMVPAEGGALIEALGLAAPAIVLRNIEGASTVGAVNADGEGRPFFILRVASYERTFAGMLSWEPTMGRDLGAFYPEYPAPEPIGTSTTSSTPRAPVRPAFRDEVLENHDVRVLRDGEGRAILVYGYRDKETLVIARNETAFKELLSRLSASRSR